MLVPLLFYVFAFLFYTYRILLTVILSRVKFQTYLPRLFGEQQHAALCCIPGEVTSQNAWSRYDRHVVGITWRDVWS